MNNDLRHIQKYWPVIPATLLSVIAIFCAGIIVLFRADSDSFVTSPDQDSQNIIENYDELEVTFIQEGREVTINAEVADTPEERQKGLMNREFLRFNNGMIFIFPTSEVRQFWMKDTLIPLDIIFIREDKVITKIHKNTTPNNTDIRYSSESPAKYVIEVNGGWTEINNVREGDKVTF